MGLLNVVEPAGAIQTGWKLIPHGEDKAASTAPTKPAPPQNADEPGGLNARPLTPALNRPTPSEGWELGEIG